VHSAKISISATLDSISAWVENVEKTAAFLTDLMGWKRHPMQFTVNQKTEDATTEAVFVDGNVGQGRVFGLGKLA